MVGDKLKKRRLELGLTQEDLANKLGYKSKTAITRIEKNINDVSQAKLIKLAKALEVSPSYFVEDINKETGDIPASVLCDYFYRLTSSQKKNVMDYIIFLTQSNGGK